MGTGGRFTARPRLSILCATSGWLLVALSGQQRIWSEIGAWRWSDGDSRISGPWDDLSKDLDMYVFVCMYTCWVFSFLFSDRIDLWQWVNVERALMSKLTRVGHALGVEMPNHFEK